MICFRISVMLVMNNMDIKNRCVAFMTDLDTKDTKQLSNWFVEKSQVWIPPGQPVEGSSRIIAQFRAIFRRYKDLNWKVNEVFQLSENRGLCISSSWGTINGKPYSNELVTDFTFNNEGKILRLSDYFKDTSCFL